MRSRRIVLVLGLFALALLLQGGCIFEPRQPDGPPDTSETPWEPPFTTTIVLANLKSAFEYENSSNYRGCFADSYRFHVDPQDSLDAGDEGYERYANWVLADEEHAAIGMFNDAATSNLTFSNIWPPDETLEITYREEIYTLTIAWGSGAHVNEEIVYKGVARMHMRRDNTGRWAIFRWVDRRVADPGLAETWGVLRGDYRG